MDFIKTLNCSAHHRCRRDKEAWPRRQRSQEAELGVTGQASSPSLRCRATVRPLGQPKSEVPAEKGGPAYFSGKGQVVGPFWLQVRQSSMNLIPSHPVIALLDTAPKTSP